MAKNKRDGAYFRERLRKDHPLVYRDLISGKYASIRAAALAAGLIRARTRLQALKWEWNTATAAERRKFVDWLTGPGGKRPLKTPHIANSEGKLLPHVSASLVKWLKDHRSKPGRIMKEIGGSNFDYRMARALAGDPLPRPVIDDLATWMRGKGLV